MRGHGGGHHHQGAQGILELGAVENNSLRRLLRERGEQQCKHAEARKRSLGKRGREASRGPETCRREETLFTSLLFYAKNFPPLITALKIAGAATAVVFYFLAAPHNLQDLGSLMRG